MPFRGGAGGSLGVRPPRRGVSLAAVRGALILLCVVRRCGVAQPARAPNAACAQGAGSWSLLRLSLLPAGGAGVQRHDPIEIEPALVGSSTLALSAEDVRRIVREEVRSAVEDAVANAVASAKAAQAVPAVVDGAEAKAAGAPDAASFEALLNLELRAHAEAREVALMESGKAVRATVPGLLHGVAPTESRRVHVIVTTDSSSYQQWQLRVCYYWFLKQAAVPGSTLHAFTRVLHTGEPDDLMDEIPTVVVPAGPKPDNGGPPIQRPGAVIAWLEAAPPVEEFVLMLEPDHILLKPVVMGAVAKGRPLAFQFSYVNFEQHEAALAPHLETAGCSAADAARTGNSPSLMHRDDLAAVAPGWRDFSLALHADPAVRAAVGWVGEMYGFSLAACAARLWLTLQTQELMLHPPFDAELGEASIIHYTYGTELMANGSVADPAKVPKEQRVWAFDKRYFERDYPGGRITAPPAGAPPSVVRLVDAINEALDAQPPAKKAPVKKAPKKAPRKTAQPDE